MDKSWSEEVNKCKYFGTEGICLTLQSNLTPSVIDETYTFFFQRSLTFDLKSEA
jgi:hypothetical protein